MPQKEIEEINLYFQDIDILPEADQLEALDIILNSEDANFEDLVALSDIPVQDNKLPLFFSVAPLITLVNNNTEYKSNIVEMANDRKEHLLNKNIQPSAKEAITARNIAKTLSHITTYSCETIYNAVKNVTNATDDDVKKVSKKTISFIKKGLLKKIDVVKLATGKKKLKNVVEDLVNSEVNIQEAVGVIRTEGAKATKNSTIKRISKYAEKVATIKTNDKNTVELIAKAGTTAALNNTGIVGIISTPLVAMASTGLSKDDKVQDIAIAAVIGGLKDGATGALTSALFAATHKPIWEAIDKKIALKERNLGWLSMPYSAVKGLATSQEKKISKFIIGIVLQEISGYIAHQISKKKDYPLEAEILSSALDSINASEFRSNEFLEELPSNLTNLKNISITQPELLDNINENQLQSPIYSPNIENISSTVLPNNSLELLTAIPAFKNMNQINTLQSLQSPQAIQQATPQGGAYAAAAVVGAVIAKFIGKKITAEIVKPVDKKRKSPNIDRI